MCLLISVRVEISIFRSSSLGSSSSVIPKLGSRRRGSQEAKAFEVLMGKLADSRCWLCACAMRNFDECRWFVNESRVWSGFEIVCLCVELGVVLTIACGLYQHFFFFDFDSSL